MNQTKTHSRWVSAAAVEGIESTGNTEDNHTLRKQLMREIMCLERQLSRLNMRPETMPSLTIKTYEDMIASRKEMLVNINTSS